jgi:23S rRNA pseudouridine2605 synthase
MKRRTMRLNRYVALATGVSRRGADDLIAGGHIGVNGQPAHLGQLVDDTATVTRDGTDLVLPARFRYVALHKPVGYVSSRRQQGSDPVLYELLPPEMRDLRLAGRLDRDSSGLVLLSDDGEFIQHASHPSAGKVKVYELELDKPLTDAHVHQLGQGVLLADGASLVTILSRSGKRLTVSLEEGRNRQLRRTFGALGYHLSKLHRTNIGAHELGDLGPGQWREVSP